MPVFIVALRKPLLFCTRGNGSISAGFLKSILWLCAQSVDAFLDQIALEIV